MKKILLLLVVYVGIISTTQAGTAAVAMPDRYGAQAARQILELDGNAIDAAVASAFVLAVTSPESGNIGGGGFMLVYLAEEDRVIAIDYREMAPAAATDAISITTKIHDGLFIGSALSSSWRCPSSLPGQRNVPASA